MIWSVLSYMHQVYLYDTEVTIEEYPCMYTINIQKRNDPY